MLGADGWCCNIDVAPDSPEQSGAAGLISVIRIFGQQSSAPVATHAADSPKLGRMQNRLAGTVDMEFARGIEVDT
jgi:hypothetical protein